MQCKSPSFCKQHVARKVMIFATCFAILINIPYCFMYTYNEHGDLVTTNFFHSWWENVIIVIAKRCPGACTQFPSSHSISQNILSRLWLGRLLFRRLIFPLPSRMTIFLLFFSRIFVILHQFCLKLSTKYSIISRWSLQVVQSSKLVSIHNIRLDTGRISAHRKRYYVTLREVGPQAERDAVEAQKHTWRKSSAGNITIRCARIVYEKCLPYVTKPEKGREPCSVISSDLKTLLRTGVFRSWTIEISSDSCRATSGFYPPRNLNERLYSNPL